MCKKIVFYSVDVEIEADKTKWEALTKLMKRTVERRRELGIGKGGMAVIDFQLRVEKLIVERMETPVIWYKYSKFRNYLVPKDIANEIFEKLTTLKIKEV